MEIKKVKLGGAPTRRSVFSVEEAHRFDVNCGKGAIVGGVLLLMNGFSGITISRMSDREGHFLSPVPLYLVPLFSQKGIYEAR